MLNAQEFGEVDPRLNNVDIVSPQPQPNGFAEANTAITSALGADDVAERLPSGSAVSAAAEAMDHPSDAQSSPDLSVVRLLEKAEQSAGKLVNLLVKYFPSFRDEARFEGRKVRLYKRAQIFVADLWAAFNATGYGIFHDIGHLTMFADYRVPQLLRSLGVLSCSPPLEYTIRDKKQIASGQSWEVQLRGCSIWYARVSRLPGKRGRMLTAGNFPCNRAVELIRREILKQHPDAAGVNAVLIDFFLYDLAKEREAAGAYRVHSYPHSQVREGHNGVHGLPA